MNKRKMKNLGINVKINGKQICKAGIDKENFVLSPMVSLVHREGGSEACVLSVGGLDSDASEHLNWYHDHLSSGDRITFEVIEGPFDTPMHRKTEGETVFEESDLQRDLKRYYQLKEELKEHLEKTI